MSPLSPPPTGILPTPPEDAEAATAGLTPRQKQILDLLRAGKGNKEIAYELGINIGTVKQHVVALFKKLNVRNRTMAVAKTFAPSTAAEPTQTLSPPDLTNALLPSVDNGDDLDTILEKRPCVILSLAVAPPPLEADDTHAHERTMRLAARHLHSSLAALAYDHDAVFLARRGNAADVIFGVQRTREFDLLRAVRTAQSVAEDLAHTVPDAAAWLRGALTAGLAVASMRRQGGWSGEAIASAGISAARALADSAQPGMLLLSSTAQDVMIAHGIGSAVEGVFSHCAATLSPAPEAIPVAFTELHQIRATESSTRITLRGRLNELSTLFHAWTYDAPKGVTIVPPSLILGEAGMGKSHLCLTFAQRCKKDGAALTIRRCQPSDGSGREPFLACDESGHDHSLDSVLEFLSQPTETDRLSSPREVVVLDDVHWLSPADQYRLFQAASHYRRGRLVLIAARRLPNDILSGRCLDGQGVGAGPLGEIMPPTILRLGRLPPDVTEAVAADRLRITGAGSLAGAALSAAGKGIAGRALGVPLFAVELARHWSALLPPDSASGIGSETRFSPLWASTPPLSLLTIVCARLDSQGLDRHVLRAVARAPRPVDAAGLALLMGETVDSLAPSLERAIKAGVLTTSSTASSQGTLSFTHPLLRAVIDFLGMDAA